MASPRASGHATTLYPVLKLYETGVLLLELRIFAPAGQIAFDEFIVRFPSGYDTELGEGGAGLSGGQKQRLSMARAFLKDAPILILDEPTAALDTISERLVFSALRRLRTGRTTIVIAHRLSTVRDADRILVLDAGAIVAAGTHETLMVTSELYRRLAAQLPDSHTPEK